MLDEDVDTAVGILLRDRGHECWNIVDAGLGGADDDAVAIYADDRDAVLITHDIEATRRRRKFTFGRHVLLRCHQLQGVDVLQRHLNEVVQTVARHGMGVYEVNQDGVVYHPPRYEID